VQGLVQRAVGGCGALAAGAAAPGGALQALEAAGKKAAE